MMRAVTSNAMATRGPQLICNRAAPADLCLVDTVHVVHQTVPTSLAAELELKFTLAYRETSCRHLCELQLP